MTEDQKFAGQTMHEVGGFFMPEINRACDAAEDEARNLRFVAVLIISAVQGDKIIGNAVMVNDQIGNQNVHQILHLALANMRREDATVVVTEDVKP